MSLLSDTFKSFFKKPLDVSDGTEPEYAIPYAAFINAFQLLNQTAFDIATNPENNDDFAITACIYDIWGSPVSDHINDKERFKPTTYSFWSNIDKGYIISFLEYKYTEIEKGEKEWGTLMMASPQMVDGELNIVPHVVFSGIYQSMPDGQLVICPREVVCMGEDNEGPVLHSMTAVAEVVCALAYMDRVLVQMRSGSKVDNLANMKVFAPEEFEKTKASVNHMFRRNVSDLEEQIAQHLESQAEAQTFDAPAP